MTDTAVEEKTATEVRERRSLYDLSSWASSLLWKLSEFGTDEEVAEAIRAEFEEAEGAIETKLTQCAYVMREQELRGEMIASEIKRLNKIKEGWVRARTHLSEHVSFHMQKIGIEEVPHPTHGLCLKKCPPSVVVTIPADFLPEEWQKQGSITADKTAIKAAWKAGIPLPEGVRIEENKHTLKIVGEGPQRKKKSESETE